MLKLWVRKRIEISPRELLRGMVECLSFENRERSLDRIEARWGRGKTFTCLSVRSGFDLLLSTLNWPAGSEVLMSGLTIPDMPRIVEEHGMVPVGVDIDIDDLSMTAESIRRKITPQTRAIVVAHLFGGLANMDAVMEVAREHNLLVVEDCAQAYIGGSYGGDKRADISMFSFGAIKTNTALTGAVFVVRREELLARLSHAHQKWPMQTRVAYFKRLSKYLLVKTISTKWIAGAIAFGLGALGKDHDRLAVKLSRGFSGGDFFFKIRHQPPVPMLRMMERKFARFDEQQIRDRTELGVELENSLRKVVDIPGCKLTRPTFWVFAVLVDDRDNFVRHLWKNGFDATTSCSMKPVAPDSYAPDAVDSGTKSGIDGTDQLPASEASDIGAFECEVVDSEKSQADLMNARFILEQIVFLPFDLAMPKSEVIRMARVINEFRPTRVKLPNRTTRKLSSVAKPTENN